MIEHLEAICDSVFWVLQKISYLTCIIFLFKNFIKDTNFFYSNHINLTSCFQNTVVKWTPCSIVWLFSPFWIYMLTKPRKCKINVSCLFITKIVRTLISTHVI
jgi:hypothetical protein